MTLLKSSLFFIVFSNPFFTYAAPTKVDSILAIVNSEVILESDLQKLVGRLTKGGMVDELVLVDKKPEQIKNDKKAQLNVLINEKILDSEVKRLNLTVTIEKVEQEIRSIAKRNNIARNDLINALKAQGVNVSDYQDFIKTRIERQSLIENEVSAKIRVGDEDVLAEYLRQNKSSNTLFENTLAHIIFNPKKGGPEAALERAQKALTRIRSGESFEVVAEQTSEDPDFSPGGLFGTFKSGELHKEMDDTVGTLGVGDVSNIVRTRGGLQILKLVGRKIVPDPAYEKQKETIRAALFETAFKKQFADWLNLKKQDSFIRIN